MIQFLRNNGINCDEGMRKDHLFQIIELHSPREKQYKIDQFLSSKGNIVVQLPPNTVSYTHLDVYKRQT